MSVSIPDLLALENSCKVVKKLHLNLRIFLRQILYDSGIPGNPGFTDWDIIASFCQLLELPNPPDDFGVNDFHKTPARAYSDLRDILVKILVQKKVKTHPDMTDRDFVSELNLLVKKRPTGRISPAY